MIHCLLAASLAILPPPQQPTTAAPPSPLESTASAYVPHRVFDTRANRFTDFEAMLADVIYADVLFLGEQHDDASTHRLEAATLEGLARRRSNVVLALEMFERDVQRPLDDYLASRIPEADFLAASRPWPRYRTDYRPMVEFARLWHWPVVAANVPRRFASLVARTGLAGLDTLASPDRALIARGIDCPRDEYFDRFAKTMGDMASHGGSGKPLTPDEQRAMLDRVYQAQCIKDETMGESVAAVFDAAPPRALVVHVNGAFHSDYAQGTVARVIQRAPSVSIGIVTTIVL